MKTPRKLYATMVAAALCATSASLTPALAQDASNTPDQTLIPQTSDTPTPNQEHMKSRCSQLIGTRVQNQQGERLGKIADVVVSFDNQRVSYCVLHVKPGIFARTRLVEVPLAAFQPGPDGSYLILNASRANLANARGFDPNVWPSAVITSWGAEPPPPVALPPAEVYGAQTPPPSVIYPPSCDTTADWDQFHFTRNANDAIDQAHFSTMYGGFLNSH